MCLGLMAGPSMAQGAADRLQTILSNVPVAALDGGEGAIIAGFGNGDAVRWIAVRGAQAGVNPNTPNRFAALRSAPPLQQAVIAATPDEAIRAAVGLNPGDWVNTWEVAQGDVRIGAMDIFPDSEMRLRGALFVRGFTEEERGGAPVMWQGEADLRGDPARVDPANPFGGEDGLPMRMTFLGDRAIWATGWDALDLVLSPSGDRLSSRADAQSVINGLRRVGNLGGLVSVRCWLRNGADLPIPGAERGPIEGFALADYANRESEGAALVLHLPERTDVEAVAASLSDAWPILALNEPPSDPEFSAGAGSITISLRSDWGEDGAAANQAYLWLQDVLNGGRLTHLLRNHPAMGG